MQHPRTLKNMISTIEAAADKDTALKCYEVHWSIINSREIGMVPQQRERIYIVAIKLAGRASTTFAWPRPVAPADLSDIYDEPGKVPVSYSRYPMRGLSAPTSSERSSWSPRGRASQRKPSRRLWTSGPRGSTLASVTRLASQQVGAQRALS